MLSDSPLLAIELRAKRTQIPTVAMAKICDGILVLALVGFAPATVAAMGGRARDGAFGFFPKLEFETVEAVSNPLARGDRSGICGRAVHACSAAGREAGTGSMRSSITTGMEGLRSSTWLPVRG